MSNEEISINWYPGHMTKARRMMQENIKLIDLVIEVVDARIPFSSRNPDIDGLAGGKSRLILLNKADMSDEKANKEWIEYYNSSNIRCLKLNSRSGDGVKQVDSAVAAVCRDKLERDRRKGILNRPVRAMVVGIPNVGKSTFINAYAGKACAKTGNKPGVTKGKQWIKLGKNLELLDTPGILWPKFESRTVGKNLALIGSINDEIIDLQELACDAVIFIKNNYPGRLMQRYGVEEDKEIAGLLDDIAVKRGCLKKGAQTDYERLSVIILDDLRSGRLGRITFELPQGSRQERQK